MKLCSVTKKPEQFLLWVHQTEWQREILAKYGNTMTPSTTFDYFITVCTNDGYTVIAEFIVQTETAACIQEALHIVKKSNPIWNPT